jgi:hypothetical protein
VHAFTKLGEVHTAQATASNDQDPAGRRRTAARLRRELQRIEARDFFPPAERETARRATDQLAATNLSEARR